MIFAPLREPSSFDHSEGPDLDAAWLRSFRRRVLAWYAKHGRDLPWRRDRDPYRIWVSEVMLQQTTVAAVVPYYERFLARFPTVGDLAAAPEHEVMRLWEGLGYYSRARNMHAAARRIVAEHGGAFPRTADELSALRGIGRYTAGAIASFAFGDRAPVVEANTIRLYSRLLAYRDDPRSTAGQKRLWAFAGGIVPRKEAGKFNQALMDLGATVCTVRLPQCEGCPVRQNCQAFALGLQDVIPLAKPKVKLTDVTEAYVVVRKGDSYLLRQRPAGERWAGLWDFPRCEISAEDAADCHLSLARAGGQKALPLESGPPMALVERLEEEVGKQTGIRVRLGLPFAELRHGVTRFRIRVLCFEAEYLAKSPTDAGSVRWLTESEFEDIALTRTARRLSVLLGLSRPR